ncbi:16S rRNA (adenine(1518)-N(6)/adenine(1519)-N(6))-dimethyltransferase RsmA [Denitrobaculum tricleocarpae]|uniref:Ribosomal RNA small subunit methyltransferase A n=1 Tax=Denitrobaculum tricleocarpae TaxID=2591009 RepID=A0A545TTY2_9PROT|nr:16S rRNA (adenine(1518)-N(6)/adenine(1519)-N(6))-dimethyltransferase RsmA [Denitrobaculum tricleocarpae]TQV80675.1 16S rRNA (adenine(1518)-N(6)/adenine(1519)-N(6))-dimethyltransferase RsmA [Denitrobaculum tricleocarpae]
MPPPSDRPPARTELPPLRETIAKYGLGARKALGQHFLLDINLTRRIARAAAPLDQGTVIEIGPGPGGLTRGLLQEGARKVIAIEKDSRCLEALREVAAAYPGRLELIEADALEIDISRLGDGPRQIVANLPYNVSTALLIQWLTLIDRDASAITRLTLMFQKEVAERLAAVPRSKDYGRLSILAQWLCEIRLLFDVPKQAFTPPPKVISTIASLKPRSEPLSPAQMPTLERITAAAFGQRRKMLRQSLKSTSQDVTGLLAGCAIDETKRAEELTVEEFCALARAVDEGKTNPGH